jgi:hypothetical protein
MVVARPGEVDATMVVTPANAALIATTVTRHAVRLLLYPFPDVGLATGVECLDRRRTCARTGPGACTTPWTWRSPFTRSCSGSTAPTPSSLTRPSGGPRTSLPRSASRASPSTPSASSRSSP